ncbi:hypothetical protein [Bradyrhizobium sp. RT3a]|uniref:hypothetical protein n=1 Tax=unclassified Bradyrhizobium TaxID=2631580 RepID=UPI003391EDEA
MGHRVLIPGQGGKIEARAARLRAAVAAELARVEEEKKPKPQKLAPKTFAHIRDYRSISN